MTKRRKVLGGEYLVWDKIMISGVSPLLLFFEHLKITKMKVQVQVFP